MTIQKDCIRPVTGVAERIIARVPRVGNINKRRLVNIPINACVCLAIDKKPRCGGTTRIINWLTDITGTVWGLGGGIIYAVVDIIAAIVEIQIVHRTPFCRIGGIEGSGLNHIAFFSRASKNRPTPVG